MAVVEEDRSSAGPAGVLGLLGRVKPLALRYVAAQVVVFLLFGPYLAQLLTDRGRLLILWEDQETLALLGTLFLLALVCVLVHGLIGLLRRPILVRLCNHLFVLAFGGGLLANLWFHAYRPHGYHIGQFGMEMSTAWLVLFGCVGYSLARPGSKLVLRCRQLCQIMSPVVLIVAFQLLQQHNYRSTIESFPPHASISTVSVSDDGRPASPVYIFVFDGCSYERSFQDGAPRPRYANLAALGRQSLVFHDAYSAGRYTHLSMAGLLFQTDRPVPWGDERAMADGDFESVFSVMGRRGYRSCMIGCYFPWRNLLGEQVDVCRAYNYVMDGGGALGTAGGEGVLAKAGMHTLNAMQNWTDPWSAFINERRRRWASGWLSPRMGQICQDISDDILQVIEHRPRNTIAVFHHPVPHFPLAGGESGDRPLDLRDTAMVGSDVGVYEQSLAYMDLLLGEFLDAMKAAGRFDDALIVFTADHSWRGDPEREESGIPYTHVPLLVKLPGQERTVSINSRAETYDLLPLILQSLPSDGRAGDVESLAGPVLGEVAFQVSAALDNEEE